MNAHDFSKLLTQHGFQATSHVLDFWDEYGGRSITYLDTPSRDRGEISFKPDDLMIFIEPGRSHLRYKKIAALIGEDITPLGHFDPDMMHHVLLMTSSGELYCYYDGGVDKCGELHEGWRKTMERIIAGEPWRQIGNINVFIGEDG